MAKKAILVTNLKKNAKNTPLRSILIFDFNSNENQNIFKQSKKIQRNEDTKSDATMQRKYRDSKKMRKNMSIKEH